VPAAAIASSRIRAFARGARPELDELSGTGLRHDVPRHALEDRQLGPRRVILGQLADLLKQLRPPRVVEVLRRRLLERAREAVEHVVGERALVGLGEPGFELDRGRVEDRRHASVAILNPAKI
jgi:hypothetical protein